MHGGFETIDSMNMNLISIRRVAVSVCARTYTYDERRYDFKVALFVLWCSLRSVTCTLRRQHINVPLSPLPLPPCPFPLLSLPPLCRQAGVPTEIAFGYAGCLILVSV